MHAAPGRKWQVLPLLATLWLLLGSAHAALEFTALTGRVVDDAGLLSAATRAQLTQLSEQHERASANQLVVVTVKSLQGYPVEDFGYQLGRYWGIGQKGRNNGVLLIVAPNERAVRIEVGYGLEGQLTDAISSHIIQSQILPHFKRGDYESGIVAGAQAIVAVFSGETQPATPDTPSIAAPHMPIPALLIFGAVAGQILAMFLSRVFAGALAGGIAAAVVWFISGTLLMSVFAAIVIFIFVALSGRSGGGMPWMGGRGGGGFGGGGFSGGGGSFGGGGASGRW
ncbi:MAG: TPM domain-containing protein [Gammaproteobacteria bacterium]|nr:TPM domain-containing protein [Gammaproteobacteria bacterium]